ncbi:hypothetical protein HMPREF9629_00606 [Peptoanaerobacter stomatis]|uniref:Uncharacterized protein n=1 Tax=Peptoanaerobacter stomatis TaxID=796937 RepID=G9X2J9_9FIRM|nr:pyocin knob domain-containing protein [Peptoanaerobacter stomatis]EHL11069.1 hypothetical protein HMPREF9629_00606 [Peptoanaerobacter stomatis]
MQETDKLKLRKPEYNEYADVMDLNYNMDILDNAVSDKLGKTEKAVDSEKLDGLDSLKFSRSYSLSNGETIPRDVLRTTNIANAYIGMINYGTEDGLPCPHSKIIYMPHNTDGYGTQIAIPYDGGNYYGVYYRNATGGNWGAWIELLDTRDRNTILTNNANTCFETGKAYYCVYQQTKNLPLGDNIDDGIIIPYMYIKGQYGFQIYMTWNGTAIYWRKLHSGNWDRWYCIGGGSWNQEVIKDSEQVGKFLRWGNYGQNHVIFDASKGVRPDGQACSSDNPAVWWQNTYPYLMGFNGTTTYGVKVNMAQWADGAGSIHGFQFRNNNGRLEALIQGVWLSVGGQIYNRLKEYNSIEVLGGAREGIQSQYQMGQEVVLFDMWKPLKITSLTWGNPQVSSSLGYSYRGISFSRVRVWLDEVLVFDDNNIPSPTNYTDRGPLRPSQYTETRYVEARSHLKIIATIANNAGNVHPALELKMMYYE